MNPIYFENEDAADDRDLSRAQELARKQRKEQGNLTVDISVDLDKAGNRNLLPDRHPSARAHKQYEQQLQAFLKSAVFVGHRDNSVKYAGTRWY